MLIVTGLYYYWCIYIYTCCIAWQSVNSTILMAPRNASRSTFTYKGWWYFLSLRCSSPQCCNTQMYNIIKSYVGYVEMIPNWHQCSADNQSAQIISQKRVLTVTVTNDNSWGCLRDNHSSRCWSYIKNLQFKLLVSFESNSILNYADQEAGASFICNKSEDQRSIKQIIWKRNVHLALSYLQWHFGVADMCL